MLGHPIVFLRVSDAPCVLSSLFAPCFLVLDDSREPTDEAAESVLHLCRSLSRSGFSFNPPGTSCFSAEVVHATLHAVCLFHWSLWLVTHSSAEPTVRCRHRVWLRRPRCPLGVRVSGCLVASRSWKPDDLSRTVGADVSRFHAWALACLSCCFCCGDLT